MKAIDPRFEKGAIAFYKDKFGVFSCKIIKKKPGRSDGIQYYRVKTDSGLFIDIPAFELMTGWEDDFPDWTEIKQGWVSWTQKEVADLGSCLLLDIEKITANSSQLSNSRKITKTLLFTLAEKTERTPR
jgi:hypothetical protein